jgi:predicted histone-like DNA-binding protein
MSIKFKTIARKNPRDLESHPKYYASAVKTGKTDVDALSSLVSQSTTVSRADVYAVLIALLETVIRELQEGRTVQLSKLGTFSINIGSEGADSPEKVISSTIKKSKIIYRPGLELKNMMKTLKYEKV